MTGTLGRLARVLPDYAAHVWYGFVGSRVGARREPLQVVQGVVLSEERVLLTVRCDLRGWELPGGHGARGEAPEATLVREVLEETGLDVEVQDLVGEYHRTGFLPHVARVYRCRVRGGALRPSRETPLVRWWDLDALPDTLFPWFRGPLDDALAERPEPVKRSEHQGLGAIWAGLRIDLRMRASGDRAG